MNAKSATEAQDLSFAKEPSEALAATAVASGAAVQ